MGELYTIGFFCELFNISDYNCTCQNIELRKTLEIFPEICEIVTEKSTIVYEPQYSRSLAAIIVFVYIFGIIGNSIVIAIALKNWRSSISYQRLIGLLGVSDFVFALLHFSTVIHLFWTNKWIYGETLCKVLQGFTMLSSIISIGLIFIISLERYLAVLHPFYWKNGTKRMNYTLGVLNIIIGIASVIPRFCYLHVDDNGTCTQRWPNRQNRLIYEIYIVVGYFCVPLAAIIYLNARIMYALYNRAIESACRIQNESKWRAKNRRIMRVFISVIIAFTLLVLPNRVVVLYFAFHEDFTGNDLYTTLTFIALVPYTLHVTINPFLYCVIDKSWRTQVFALVKCRLKKKKEKFYSSSVTNVIHSKTVSLLNNNVVEYHTEMPRVIAKNRKPTETSLVPDPDRETIL